MYLLSKINRAGFTLVELLIVIVVIAILAAVSVVAYQGVSARATNSSVQSTVGVMEKALKLYLQEKGEPLQVSDAVGVTYGVNMTGGGAYIFDEYPACVGDWENISAPGGGDCTNYMPNTSITSSQVLQAYKTTLDNSGMKNVFPKIRVPSIAVQETAGGHAFEHKGLRYALAPNSSRMFIYYAQIGKNVCMSGDLSIRSSHVIDHPNRSWNDSWERGGDYTTNNTTMCQRTIRY